MTSWKLKYIVFYSPRDLMWPREQKKMWLLSLWLLIISHYPANSGHRSRRNGDIAFFICHVTWCVHVTNGLCDFVDTIFSPKATSLSRLVAIGFVEVEKKFFHLSRDYLTTWSQITRLFWRWSFTLNHQPAKYSGHKSCESSDIIDVTTQFCRLFWRILHC